MSYLYAEYQEVIAPRLMNLLKINNRMAVPKLVKVILNMGVGKATQDSKRLDDAVQVMTVIAGQKPIVTRARKSIAAFKLREGQGIGVKVTLRGALMYSFVERFINIALPRVRGLEKLPTKSDGKGGYSLGVNDCSIFSEVEYSAGERRGLNINIVTTAKNNLECLSLLQEMHFPLRTFDDRVCHATV